MVKGWLKQKKVETLNWPPFSPDMSPIEHLWDELERGMKKHHPKNKEELKGRHSFLLGNTTKMPYLDSNKLVIQGIRIYMIRTLLIQK